MGGVLAFGTVLKFLYNYGFFVSRLAVQFKRPLLLRCKL
jgi:hypothetical protein